MTKKKNRSRGKSLLSSMERLAPAVLVAAPGAGELISGADGKTIGINLVWDYTGYDTTTKTWNPHRVFNTYFPPIAVVGMFKLMHKAIGMIKRI